jgi:BCD family chlorophyll transporter-like MFS transporter
VLNTIALWKQEARDPKVTAPDRDTPTFSELWQSFMRDKRNARLLTAIGIGAAGFAMQDALLEPYGGEILKLSVGATTGLTGSWALGSLIGFMWSGRMLGFGGDPMRIAARGIVLGINAFLLVLFAAPLGSPFLLYIGALMIGIGLGMFSVGTLMEAMALAKNETAGMALGAWGAVQATCAGAGIAIGGILRDVVAMLVQGDAATATLAMRSTGYSTVYVLEIALLLAGLVALGPLVGRSAREARANADKNDQPFGLQEFPT